MLGLFGALIVATFDGHNSYKSFKENDRKMGVLYGTAVVTGLSLGVILAYPAIIGAAAVVPVIALLFVVVVVVGILIEYLKDNPIEDWLERCCWGMLPAERYPNQNAEQAAYQKLLGV